MYGTFNRVYRVGGIKMSVFRVKNVHVEVGRWSKRVYVDIE